MIGLFGNILLIIALVFSCLQCALPIIGYWRNNVYLLAAARPAAIGQFFLVLSAYLLLTYAFVISDFSILYVANNSHQDLPLMYRATALWGAHEGSILLWVLILNIWTVVFALSRSSGRRDITISLLGFLSLCFLLFLLLTSNPFITTNEILAGRDLNPLLQDPGFIIHPPMLYLGYVGFSVTFAYTLAALFTHQLNREWATIANRYATAAWCFLTIGIMLGSWWAYRVLGWGGFWFWDPVENASLLPWLAGTALIHVLVLVQKRFIAVNWAVFLALVCFSLSLLGTFLVRSGILISVHSFASDPSRGLFLLLLLAVLITIAFTTFAWRASTTPSTSLKFVFFSRESTLLINSGILFTAMLTILLGTLYPMIVEVLHLGTISVGAPYFNIVMMPLVMLLMFFMGIAGLCTWQGTTFAVIFQHAWKKLLLCLLFSTITLFYIVGQYRFSAWLGLILSCWIILSLTRTFRHYLGMSLAHFGFALLAAGILLSSLLSTEREVRMKPGDSTLIGPYQFFFLNTETANGSNYRGIRAEFDVVKHTHTVTHLFPEKRIYPVRDTVMTKVDIHPGIFRDLYIALGEPLDQTFWSVRIYYKPFIRWIWLGGIFMMLGGLVAIISRVKRYDQSTT